MPQFLYACPAWFIYDPTGLPRFSVPAEGIRLLRSAQTECLISLSGARINTNKVALQSLLHIFDVVTRLYTCAMSHRCRFFASNDQRSLHKQRFRNLHSKYKARMLKHAYHLLAKSACRYLDEQIFPMPKDSTSQMDPIKAIYFKEEDDRGRRISRDRCIKSFWEQQALLLCAESFDRFRRLRRYYRQHRHLIYRYEYTDNTLKWFRNLDRPQSTMAIYIITGNIPLNGNPIYRAQMGIMDYQCPRCHDGIHTAEHLFDHCKALEGPRQLLHQRCGNRKFESLMTERTEIATSWAIQYFDIELFDTVKKKAKYQFE